MQLDRTTLRKALTAVAASAAIVGLLAACGVSNENAPTPDPVQNLGGDSQILQFTPTPTAMLPDFTPQPPAPTPTTGPSPTPGGNGGGPDAGRQVFLAAGCTGCHVVASVPEANGTFGPELTNVATNAETRVPGLAVEEYLHQSVLEPGAFVVPGYPNAMPAGLVAEGERLDDLIAFLLTLE